MPTTHNTDAGRSEHPRYLQSRADLIILSAAIQIVQFGNEATVVNPSIFV